MPHTSPIRHVALSILVEIYFHLSSIHGIVYHHHFQITSVSLSYAFLGFYLPQYDASQSALVYVTCVVVVDCIIHSFVTVGFTCYLFNLWCTFVELLGLLPIGIFLPLRNHLAAVLYMTYVDQSTFTTIRIQETIDSMIMVHYSYKVLYIDTYYSVRSLLFTLGRRPGPN